MKSNRYTPKHAEPSRPSRPASGSSSTRTSSYSSDDYRTRRTASDSYRRTAEPPRRSTAGSRSDETVSRRSTERRPAPPPEKKPEKEKTGCALASLYFILVFGIAVCISLVLIFSVNDILALVKPDDEISVVVTEDTTVQNIGTLLDDSGVVNYGSLFGLFNKLKGDGDIIVSTGSYALNPTMDYGQIVRALTKTTSTTSVKVTIPEGYTLKQIRQTLLENNITSVSLLDNAMNMYPFKHTFLKELQPPRQNWLEGYLFPDTYEFIQDSKQPVHEVINIMLNNFDRKYDENIREGAGKLGLNPHEVVTIASLIEREAREESEFAKIAGVIYNRLRNPGDFPYLQIDAALQYAVGHNNKLTEADLKLESPYNLYLNKGLPPGPICNPGYNALYAATHPDEHGYYYYVAMPDGTHLFAKTNSQHNKNRRTADRAWANAS